MSGLVIPTKVGLRRYTPQPVSAFFKQSERVAMETLRQLASLERVCTYELGCYLYRVLRDGLWKKAEHCRLNPDYSNYGNWVFGELGFSSRKGRYLANIARRIVELSVPLESVNSLMVLGWSKTYHLLRAENRAELETWHQATVNMTEVELITYVRGEIAARKTGEEETEEEGEDKLGSPVTVKIKFNSKLYYELFRQVSSVMSKKFGMEKMEDVIGCACGHYMATSLPGRGEEIPMQLDQILDVLERQYKVTLSVIVKEDKSSTSSVSL